MENKTLAPFPTSRTPFVSLRRAMDSLFDNWFDRGWEIEPSRWLEEARALAPAFTPSLDLAEDEKEIRVTAELPGLEQKDIKITLNKDRLSIQGEKKEEKEEKEKNYYRRERSFGSFTREITLPREIQADQVKANFKNGILTVHLPKSPKAREETKVIKIAE